MIWLKSWKVAIAIWVLLFTATATADDSAREPQEDLVAFCTAKVLKGRTRDCYDRFVHDGRVEADRKAQLDVLLQWIRDQIDTHAFRIAKLPASSKKKADERQWREQLGITIDQRARGILTEEQHRMFKNIGGPDMMVSISFENKE